MELEKNVRKEWQCVLVMVPNHSVWKELHQETHALFLPPVRLWTCLNQFDAIYDQGQQSYFKVPIILQVRQFQTLGYFFLGKGRGGSRDLGFIVDVSLLDSTFFLECGFVQACYTANLMEPETAPGELSSVLRFPDLVTTQVSPSLWGEVGP